MKKFSTKIIYAFIGTLILSLSGCIDVKQDIWINKDGSGMFIFDVGISKQMKAMMEGFGGLQGLGGEEEGGGNEIPFSDDPEKVVTELKENEFVKSAEFKEAKDAKYERTIYTIELSDITKIKDVMKSSSLGAAAEQLGGEGQLDESNDFEIKKTDKGTFEILATMKGNEDEVPDDPQEAEFAATMMKQMFGDAAMTLRINAPAITHNGKEEEEAIVWTIPLADLATGGSLEAKGEFKPGGSGSSNEEPREEPKVEPKEEPKVEPKEEPKAEPKEEPKEEEEEEATKGNNTIIIGVLVAVILLLVILLMKKKK